MRPEIPLPAAVLHCIDRLEQAGFSAYAVGGCVRDSLLGLQPHDYDLCTDALPAEICRCFAHLPLVRNGEKHGTVGVVISGSVFEITTFRTEGGYRDARHPDWVRFVPSLEEDLARRDFTVNAMAYHPRSGLADPFGGLSDLHGGLLRAVGQPAQRFAEDALRILRGVRFCARYRLTPEEQTLQAMLEAVPLLDALARERVFDELNRLLPLVQADALVRFAPILTRVLPELAPAVGFWQHNPHHDQDVYTHSAQVTAAVAPVPALRWAALLHDAGKPATFTLDSAGVGHFYGHAALSAELADAALLRLKAPTALRRQVVTLIRQHMAPLEPDRRLLKKRLSRLGPETVELLLQLQRADLAGRDGPAAEKLRLVAQLLQQLRQEAACLQVRDLALDGHDLMALGLQGPAIGRAQHLLLERVLEETLPNEKEALSRAVKEEML